MSAGTSTSTCSAGYPLSVVATGVETVRSSRATRPATTSAGDAASETLPVPSQGSPGTLTAPVAATAIPLGPAGPWLADQPNWPADDQPGGSETVHDAASPCTGMRTARAAGDAATEGGADVASGVGASVGWPPDPSGALALRATMAPVPITATSATAARPLVRESAGMKGYLHGTRTARRCRVRWISASAASSVRSDSSVGPSSSQARAWRSKSVVLLMPFDPGLILSVNAGRPQGPPAACWWRSGAST